MRGLPVGDREALSPGEVTVQRLDLFQLTDGPPKNASNGSVPQRCAGGHLKSDHESNLTNGWTAAAKTPRQVPLRQLKANAR